MNYDNEYDSPNRSLRGGEIVKASNTDLLHEPVQAQPLEVKVNGNFERAFRIFKSIVQKERILSLYKEKQTYEKPSQKKRRKRNEMARKMRELELKETISEEQ